MKSYHIQYGGGHERLQLREHPVPEPGPTEVLVRGRANSLSARELRATATGGEIAFDETPAAFRYYVDGGGFGKVVITQPA
jgi:hypothetical protein